MAESSTTTAAFFRVEGVLTRRGALAAAAYLAANGQGFRERAFRLGQLALAGPAVALLRQNDRTLTNRMAWAACRGMSADRLAVLGEEFYEDYVSDKLLDSGLELVQRARRAGHRIVLVSEGVEAVVGPLARAVRGVDDFFCNRLEVVDGETTGRLTDPVFGGHDAGAWVRAYAEEHGVDLARSVAYAAKGPDLLLLAAVGEPCAVNADYTLRRAATEARWARLDYAA